MTDVPSGHGPYRTGVIWVVLGGLLTVGSAAAALVVYALVGLYTTTAYLLDAVLLVVGFVASIYLILLIAGILYRIDRLRGVPHRRIELFE